MTPWEKVVEATAGHAIYHVSAHWADDRSWVYVDCTCGETFNERDEYTDHIRRIVFDAVALATGGGQEGAK